MNDVKKIDIHAHATLFPELTPNNFVTGYRMVSPEELISFYDKLNIEKGVLLPLTAPEYQMETIPSNVVCAIAKKYPGRFEWFCGVDPRACGHSNNANISEALTFYKNLGAKGVGELTAQLPIDDPLIDNFFYHCAECDMPVTIHIAPMNANYHYYGIKDDLGLPRLEKMLKKHKKLKILGHSQLFWAEMSSDVTDENRTGYPVGKVKEGRIAELLRNYENLYCDFSANSGMNALARDPEYAAKFIEEFSDRILYGCDICATYNTHPFEFEEFLNKMRADKMFSEDNYYKFVRGNAIKLLNL